jgi:hypothetical protein
MEMGAAEATPLLEARADTGTESTHRAAWGWARVVAGVACTVALLAASLHTLAGARGTKPSRHA